MTVIMHGSMARSLAFILANKLQSSTLLATQLTRLFIEAYEVGRRWGGRCCGGVGEGTLWWWGSGGWRCQDCCAATIGCLRQNACCAVPCWPPHPPLIPRSPPADFAAAVLPPPCAPPPCAPPAAALQDQPCLVEAAVADLQAVMERDPACTSSVHPLLFFKGYQVGAGTGVWVDGSGRVGWGGAGRRGCALSEMCAWRLAAPVMSPS